SEVFGKVCQPAMAPVRRSLNNNHSDSASVLQLSSFCRIEWEFRVVRGNAVLEFHNNLPLKVKSARTNSIDQFQRAGNRAADGPQFGNEVGFRLEVETLRGTMNT